MRKANEFFEKTHHGLIVSCQALPEEPLHSSYIMSRMAYAAKLGGACGLRANSVEDITEIRKTVSLPMIGIIKKVYGDCPVYITPTMEEVDALVKTGVEVIAIDATSRKRPDGRTISEFFPEVRKKYPEQLFMADCATLEDGRNAEKLGFDIVGTTLTGYTSETENICPPDFDLIHSLCGALHVPLIVEGGIWAPETLHDILQIEGVHACVIGSAITRPMEITRHYVAAIEQED